MDDLVVSLCSRAGGDFDGREAREDGALPVATDPFDSFEEYGSVGGALEDVELDDRVALGILGVQGDVAAQQRALDGGDGDTEGVHGKLGCGGPVAGEEVGSGLLSGFVAGKEFGVGLVCSGKVVRGLLALDGGHDSLPVGGDVLKGQESKTTTVRLADRTGPVGIVLGPCCGVLPRVGREEGIKSAQVRGGKHHIGFRVVLQVSSDGGEVLLDLDSSGLEDICWADTTNLEDVRCENRASSHDHLTLCVRLGSSVVSKVGERDTLGCKTVEEDLSSRNTGDELQVATALDRVVVGFPGVRTGLCLGVEGSGNSQHADSFTGRVFPW